MIRAEEDTITQEKQEKLKTWLVSQESQLLEEIIKGQIADLIAKASNHAMEQAAGVLASRDVPASTKEYFAGAAVLKLFLSTLAELRKQETFRRVKLSIH